MIDYQSGDGGGYDRPSVIKFSAMSGDFVAVNRVRGDNGKYENEFQDIPLPIRVVMDLEAIEIGYLSFRPVPDFRLVKVGEPMPPQPDDLDENGKKLYKMGFRVQLGNSELGLREMAASSRNVYDSVQQLYKQYEAERQANPNKVPVVDIVGTDKKVNEYSGNSFKVPKWSIVGWTERPAFLDGGETPTAPALENVAPAPAVPPTATVQDDDIFKL